MPIIYGGGVNLAISKANIKIFYTERIDFKYWTNSKHHGIVIESDGSIIQSQDLCNRNKSLNRFLSFHFMIELMSIPNINWMKSSLILCCSLTLEHEFMASEMLPNIQIVDNIQVNAQLLSDSSIW